MEGSHYLTALFIFSVSTLLFYGLGQRLKLRKLLLESLKGAVVTICAFAIAYVFCFFFVSPAQLYNGQKRTIAERETSISDLTNQVEKLKQSPEPYIKFQLDETNRQLVAAQKTAVDNFDKYIHELTAPKFHASYEKLTNADDFLNQLEKKTNRVSLAEKEQRHAAKKAVEDTMTADSDAKRLSPIFPFWEYSVLAYEEILTNAAKAQGVTNLNVPKFPDLDYLSYETAVMEQMINSNIISCNGWSSLFYLRGFPGAWLNLVWNGKKSKSATLQLACDDDAMNLNTVLYIDGDAVDNFTSGATNRQQCIANINEAIRDLKDNMAPDIKN